MGCFDWCRERCTLRVGAMVFSSILSVSGIVGLVFAFQALKKEGRIDLVRVSAALFQIIVGVIGIYGAFKRYAKLMTNLLYIVAAGFAIQLLLSVMNLFGHELQVQRTIGEACVQPAEKERAQCRHLIWSFRGNELYESWAAQIAVSLLVYGCFMTTVKSFTLTLKEESESDESVPTEDLQNSQKETMMQHGIMMLSGAMIVMGLAGFWVTCKSAEVTVVVMSVVMMMRTAGKACVGMSGLYAAWASNPKFVKTYFWVTVAYIAFELLVIAGAMLFYELSIRQYVNQTCGKGAGRANCEAGIRAETGAQLFGSLIIKGGVMIFFGGLFLTLVHFYRRRLEGTEKKTDAENPNESTPLTSGK